jgi:hypothetical protein
MCAKPLLSHLALADEFNNKPTDYGPSNQLISRSLLQKLKEAGTAHDHLRTARLVIVTHKEGDKNCAGSTSCQPKEFVLRITATYSSKLSFTQTIPKAHNFN